MIANWAKKDKELELNVKMYVVKGHQSKRSFLQTRSTVLETKGVETREINFYNKKGPEQR